MNITTRFWYKAKAVQVYSRICQLEGKADHADRLIKRQFQYRAKTAIIITDKRTTRDLNTSIAIEDVNSKRRHIILVDFQICPSLYFKSFVGTEGIFYCAQSFLILHQEGKTQQKRPVGT
ncbi:unnamed protein product [Nesidiocoris tenuis]|uniref:Uncharacterized protein n=1 Tax=Nesidiocoris tenuis TaxID=355587 RepID=A0A6H5HMH4_9HEMI|nr:unnamed protein product [Nesidiocoris tenuis]